MTDKKQIISQFLAESWHDSEEEPCVGSLILVERKDLHGKQYKVDININRWEVHRRIENIIRWAYLEHFLPPKE